MDTVSPATRSSMMRSIRGADTSPELVVRRYLHAAGLRYSLHDRRLPGRPDIVLCKYRVAIFVHGCFWHRHVECPKTTTPTTRPDFWAAKFAGNVARDARNEQQLLAAGWRVLTIWECEIGALERLDRLFWEIVSGE